MMQLTSCATDKPFGGRRRPRTLGLSVRIVLMYALLAPAALHGQDEASVMALERNCEAAREVRLAPLRAAEIAKCKSDRRNDPAYCERFWKDYGNPVRLRDGQMSPRLFDDLPECVAAYKARRQLAFK